MLVCRMMATFLGLLSVASNTDTLRIIAQNYCKRATDRLNSRQHYATLRYVLSVVRLFSYTYFFTTFVRSFVRSVGRPANESDAVGTPAAYCRAASAGPSYLRPSRLVPAPRCVYRCTFDDDDGFVSTPHPGLQRPPALTTQPVYTSLN